MFHGPFSFRVKFNYSIWVDVLLPQSCNEGSIHPAKVMAERQRWNRGANALDLCASVMCEMVFSFELGVLCNFSRETVKQPLVLKQLSDNSGSGCKTLRAIHKYILFVSISTESAIF